MNVWIGGWKDEGGKAREALRKVISSLLVEGGHENSQ
jgi:hypothetical protein